jgi:integrase
VLTLAVWTGMRRKELVNLRWDQVDFDAGEIAVIDSKGDDRVVPLLSSVADVLKALQAEESRIGGYVFAWSDGRPWRPDWLTHAFILIREKSGIKHARLHDLRATLATHCAATGVNQKVAQELLGHADLATTATYYQDVDRAMKRAAVAGIEAEWQRARCA